MACLSKASHFFIQNFQIQFGAKLITLIKLRLALFHVLKDVKGSRLCIIVYRIDLATEYK